eukprot:CAMPEP_0176067338 /NCGR_PEP_ID=MMETSP0120_2-20121206/33610_1 /TAXON_ID=160619 /ORGANISM="Kryptoperidinium foliaceum, Strain CCMP 1326" /LENGTH=359 /DNA_ID=CAMNT_0017400953 /DNA_START=91 /DNA_END=1166 /DNA_ORIENTATION=-
MDSLDDAFADFLKEVDDVEVGAEASPPSAKKPRIGSAFDKACGKGMAEELRKAAFSGKLALVQQMLSDLPIAERLLLIDDADIEDGFAALHLAVLQGHIDVARCLVKRRADVDLPTRSGDTPLMCAAEAGSIAMCKELLHLGADASIKNGTKTAMLQARVGGHRRLYDLLSKHLSDLVAGHNSGSVSKEKAAQARRAANAELVARAVKEAQERDEEEAYWASIRARKERRETLGEDEDKATREAYAAAKAEADKAAAALAAEEEAAALSKLPPEVRPHYQKLDISHDASEAEVRKAYRRLALKYHPDKNKAADAKDMFTQVAVAYEAICEYLASVDCHSSRSAGRTAEFLLRVSEVLPG